MRAFKACGLKAFNKMLGHGSNVTATGARNNNHMIGEAGFAGQINSKDLDPFVGVERRLDQATDVRRLYGRI